MGIGISAAAVLVMRWLGLTKHRLAAQLKSGALCGDAVSSFTCAYLTACVPVGLVLNAWFHWWWAKYLAALEFLYWLVGETGEAWEEAQAASAESPE